MTSATAAGATPLAARFGAGTASAAPGERAFGHLSATLPDGQTVPFALWVVNGRRPGPVLYVHSTQHGNEISGHRGRPPGGPERRPPPPAGHPGGRAHRQPAGLRLAPAPLPAGGG